MPKKTDEDIAARKTAIQDATKEATMVPFTVLEKTKEAAELALVVAEKGNKNSLSDSGVAGLTAEAAAEGALYNVMINLQDIEDETFCEETAQKAWIKIWKGLDKYDPQKGEFYTWIRTIRT